ncbi:MAG: tetratricopeptide repeat protein [Balneolaceae bacterium]
MKKHIYSLFAVLLVAVFMVNCETGNPLVKPIQTGIDSQNYPAALSAADTLIFKEPANPLGYYYKGVVLGKMADAEPIISNRKPIYSDMRAALDEASLLYAVQEKPGDEAEQILPLVLETWSIEHNAAIPYATNDSVMSSVENPLDLAIAHLVNATTINPDSTLSYDVLAQVYYMNSEFENAAVSLTRVIELEEMGLASEYDRLGSYYFLSEQPEKAVAAIEEGLEIYPDSISLIQKLADGLFQIDRTEEALRIMDRLVESEPDNARYHLVIGTRVYQRVLNLSDTYTENSDKIYDLERNDGSDAEINALKSQNETLESEINQLTDRAEKELLIASELDATIPSTFNTLGILYQNKSASLFDKRNNTVDNDEAAKFDEMAKEEAKKAMTYYERATELDPDNTSYWGSLFRIYTLLDMRDKAEAAMEKAGM